MKKHTTEQILQAAAGLARMVLDLQAQCDRSKLDSIEIERLQEAAEQAKLITDELSYYPDQDDRSFK